MPWHYFHFLVLRTGRRTALWLGITSSKVLHVNVRVPNRTGNIHGLIYSAFLPKKDKSFKFIKKHCNVQVSTFHRCSHPYISPRRKDEIRPLARLRHGPVGSKKHDVRFPELWESSSSNHSSMASVWLVKCRWLVGTCKNNMPSWFYTLHLGSCLQQLFCSIKLTWIAATIIIR